MELPENLRIIHQPVRLRIMGLLWKQRDVSYTRARDTLGLTDGNLAAHVKRLEAAGLASSRRVLAGDHFEVRYALTREGANAFRDYLAALQGFLDETDGV